MDILYLLDRLESVVNEGWHVPFTSNVIVREDECLELVDQMRVSIPAEVERAKQIERERDQIIAQAQGEAGRIVALSKEQAADALNSHKVLKEAQDRAEAIIEEAQRQAEALKSEADEYAIKSLIRLEDQLKELLATVDNGIATLQEGSEGKAEQEGGERVGGIT